MIRLVIMFAVFAVAYCSAGPLGYNYNQRQNQNIQQQQTVTKSFYFFSAPDDDQNPTQINRVTSNVKKHEQIVFIKAPEYNAYTNAAFDLARQAIETKTQIYLLSKEPDLADLERRVQEIRGTSVQKPEVHFVKYKTPIAAHAAQEAPRTQYENVPVTSTSVKQAVPVSNYTKSASANEEDDLYTASRPPFLPTGVDVVPGSSYLPPFRGQTLA